MQFYDLDLNKSFGDKTVLITGGAGFIGGAFVKRLLLETKCKVYIIDKLNYASDLTSIEEITKSENKLINISERYKFFKCDIANRDNLENIFNQVKPDLVFNFAAETHVDRSIDDPNSFIYSNIIGTFNLLECSRKLYEKLSLHKRKEFLFHQISTDEVFGSLDNEGKFSENTKYDPRSPYSASKASSDHLVMAWYKTFMLPIVITNCSNNYGPWQFPEKLIPLVILKALSGENIPIYGDGLNIRDWLFVEDHIDAIILAAIKCKKGESYCIGGFGEKSNKEVVESICIILDKIKPKKETYKGLIQFVEDRPSHDRRYAINSKKIQSELGWFPKYSFKDGLLETIYWYLNNLEWCRNVQKKANYKGERIGLNIKSKIK